MSVKGIFLASRTFSSIQDTIDFFEKSAIDSKTLRILGILLEKLYPKQVFELFDNLNSRQKSRISKNIFSPVLALPLLYIFFIAISNYRLSNLALITVGIGLLFFYTGTRLSISPIKETVLNNQTKETGILLFFLGLIFLSADLISAGSIPLLNPSARSRLVVSYTMLAQLIPPGGILLISYFGEKYKKGKLELKKARIYSFITLSTTLLLISTLGFRTQIIVSLLGSFIAMYLMGLIGFIEVLLSLALAGFGVVFLGYLRAIIQGSPIGFFDVIGARVGLTLSVFDFLVKRFMPFGANKGYTLLATFSSLIPGLPGPRLGPRTIVARLFGIMGISVTSTLLGTIVLDLGIVGVALFMLLLGHVLQTVYNSAKTGSSMGVGIYSVLLAYSLVGIETGLVDFNVIMMFLFGYLAIRVSA